MSTLISSILTGAIVGVIVAFVSPRFAHLVWKRQRLREQQIIVAERFAKIGSNLVVFGHMTSAAGWDALGGHDRVLENASIFLEQESLLVLIFCLFKRRDTLDAALGMKAELTKLGESGPARPSEQEVRVLHALRVDLVSKLFGEAFGLTDDLIKRNKARNKQR